MIAWLQLGRDLQMRARRIAAQARFSTLVGGLSAECNPWLLQSAFMAWQVDWRAHVEAEQRLEMEMKHLEEKRSLDMRLEEMHLQVQQLSETLEIELQGKSDLIRKLRDSQRNYQECAWKLNGGTGPHTAPLPLLFDYTAPVLDESNDSTSEMPSVYSGL